MVKTKCISTIFSRVEHFSDIPPSKAIQGITRNLLKVSAMLAICISFTFSARAANPSYGPYHAESGWDFDGKGSYNFRMPINAGTFTVNGNQLRINLEASSTANLTIVGAYIGEKAASGDAYDIQTGTIKQITFNIGAASATIPTGTTLYSDWIPFNYDKSKNYIISIGTTGGFRAWSQSGYGAYRKDNAQNNAGSENVKLYTTSPAVYALERLEIGTGTVITHTIAVSSGQNGSISPSGNITVPDGASQNFTITPLSSYQVSDVLVDGVSVGAVSAYKFTNVTANHSILANFAFSTPVPKDGASSDTTPSSPGTTTTPSDTTKNSSPVTTPLPSGTSYYYVSPSGNDGTGDGSFSRPWRAIQKAASTMPAGSTCHVMDGVYYEMVKPTNSNVSFVAEGPSVNVKGTRPITGWTVYSGNIWMATVSIDFSELYADGLRMVPARWPNLTGGDMYKPNFNQCTANGTTISLIDSKIAMTSSQLVGAKICMLPGLAWTTDVRTVNAYDAGSHSITFDKEISYSSRYSADKYSLYFLFGKLSFLDAPSEWFLDSATHVVYLWMPDGSSPNSHSIEASGGSGGFNLSGMKDVKVSNFKLFGCTLNLTGAVTCTVENCTHLYPQSEVFISGSGNTLAGCEIAYTSLAGIHLLGNNNTITRCHVHHADYWGDEKGLIDFYGGTNNIISDCVLHDAGRDGIFVQYDITTSKSIIEHNEIYNTGLIAKDCGAFYSYQVNGNGMEIRYNIVHDVNPKVSPQYGVACGYGIYLDSMSNGFNVHHNVGYLCVSAPLYFHQQCLNTHLYNNTMIGSAMPGAYSGVILTDAGTNTGITGTVLEKNIAAVYGTQNCCIRIQDEVPVYRGNGYYNAKNSSALNSLTIEEDAIVGNPLFTNAAAFDFSLQAGSPMLGKGAYEGTEKPGTRYTVGPVPVAAKKIAASPTAFKLDQNFPNPFNPTTTISFHLVKAGNVKIDIYNVKGQKVDTILNTMMSVGSHRAIWNASKFSAGVYFYTITAGDISRTEKMTLLK
jgi:hypothetical protein